MNVLVVCTGNTCRSPLAAAIAGRAALPDLVVESAGTQAVDGSPATPEAIAVAAERGLALDSHSARLLTSEHVARADLVLAMEQRHAARIEELGGSGAVRVLGVPDPLGHGIEAYRRCADVLERAIEEALP